jgi:FtsP/CotA-like multicopper oxidase with cupredoxin domain
LALLGPRPELSFVRPGYGKPLGSVIVPRANAIDKEIVLDAAERSLALPCFNGHALPVWTFTDAGIPTVRLRLGDRLVARVKNQLPRDGEHISIHWHGIRLPNDQDGVPYLTQAPIYPGSEHVYAFTPPDTGTFFFHTHCNTAEQTGRGLIGVLIIEGDETERYDAEHVLMLKDWRISPDGRFLPFFTDGGAAKAGTTGTVRSVNGEIVPRFIVPASADIRLRLLNVDPVRISELGIEGAEAGVVAVDGIACPPFQLKSWRAGPATRLDIVMRSPAHGATARLVDYFAPSPVPLADFESTGLPTHTTPFEPAPLRASRIKGPDLSTAERMRFSFSATGTGEGIASSPLAEGIEIGALCLSSRSFWAINKQSWPSGNHSRIAAPLAELTLGRTYIFELENLTPQTHPIHMHGHTFTFVSSNKRHLPPHKADTIPLLPREVIEVAFVADNPGLWMLHCHILEHQETGMMGYLRVA